MDYIDKREHRKIVSGFYPLRIVEGRQRKHIYGSREFEQNRLKMQKESPGSEPSILSADPVELIMKYIRQMVFMSYR